MTDKQYILFDLDGTITDSAGGIFSSARYALERLGRPSPDDSRMRDMIGPPLTVGFAQVCSLVGDEIEQAVALYREHYRAGGLFECTLYEGVEQLLRRLADAGRTVVLATSKPQEFAERILEHFALTDCFDYIVGATFDSSRADKSAVIAHALLESGADRAGTVMIGDRYHDIEGAKANGIQSIGVVYGFGRREELVAAGADLIAADVAELSRILI